MNAQQYQRVKELFMKALPMEPAERSSFLDAACGQDKELRAQVEDIFKHHDPATILQQDLGSVPPGAVEAGNRGAGIPAGDAGLGAFLEHHESFVAGTIVGDRYRIVGPLGRGGMGEVYRADDLKIGQPVALKFLPSGRAKDPAWLARFRQEVRLARSVTHPNVCRIYDIDEIGDHAFISMEYIDGEDLRSLLRRIGRLPRDKTLEVARQLCAGLSAAHEQGVLHRDLKPANVMLDGTGRVKITDFGIASLTQQSRERLPMAGTPAYIAPELLVGKPPSPQSDIYSLGLVLYEMVTGKPAFTAGTFETRLAEPGPEASEKTAGDADPVLWRVIVQCLNADPALRPQSAQAMAASLPGADPLREAMLAGHTPSPDTVAGAMIGPVRAYTPWGWFAGAIVSLVVIVFLAGKTFLLSQAGLARAPAVLEEQARRVIHDLARTTQTQGRAFGFVVTADRGASAAIGRLPGETTASIYFEYRQGEKWVSPRGPLAMPTLFDLAWPSPGQRLVRLDAQGRLLLYRAEPPASDGGVAGSTDLNWSLAFSLAGLNLAAFEPIVPEGGNMHADRRVAWRGPHPDDPARQVEVQAGTDGPWIVLFRVADAEGRGALSEHAPPRMPANETVRFGVFLLLLMGSMMLAWQNIRAGQVDRRGAWRLAMFALAVDGVFRFSASLHTSDPAVEAGLLLTSLRFTVFTAMATWVFYIALEPYVRRFWPHSIIAWSRLLLGKIRDPYVGRDVLIGVTAGSGIVLIQQASVLIAKWSGIDPVAAVGTWDGPDLGLLIGFRDAVGTLSRAVLMALWLSMLLLLLLLLLRLLLRKPWVAAVAFVAVATVVLTVSWESIQSFPWLTGLTASLVLSLVLTRAGLLAGAIGLLTVFLLVHTPLTLDVHVWYAEQTAMILTIVAALLVFGLSASLTRRVG